LQTSEKVSWEKKEKRNMRKTQDRPFTERAI